MAERKLARQKRTLDAILGAKSEHQRGSHHLAVPLKEKGLLEDERCLKRKHPPVQTSTEQATAEELYNTAKKLPKPAWNQKKSSKNERETENPRPKAAKYRESNDGNFWDWLLPIFGIAVKKKAVLKEDYHSLPSIQQQRAMCRMNY